MPLDLSTDWQIFDGLEDVTYFRQLTNQGGTFDIGQTVTGLRRAIATNELAAEQLPLNTIAAVWHIASDEFETPDAPLIGDRIIDPANRRWRVNSVSYETLLSRWRLTCTKERA